MIINSTDLRYTHLEMYRWKWHNDVYIHTGRALSEKPSNVGHGISHMSWRAYWREYGTFISILPRQTGKTEMLILLAKEVVKDIERSTEDYMMVVSYKAARDKFRKAGIKDENIARGTDSMWHIGLVHEDINLFVDEFSHINTYDLDDLLNYPWKSVTMTSSLK